LWFLGREELIHEKLQQKLYKNSVPNLYRVVFF
jgi:hypothetical protein